VCAQPWQDWGPDRREVTIRIDDEQEQSPRPGNVRTGKKHKKKKGQKEAPPCQCCCRAPLATLVVFVVMLVIILAVVARSYALYAKELAAAGNSANGGRVGALLQEVGDSGGNSGEYASSGEQTVLSCSLSHFQYMNAILLPRQARDKHREGKHSKTDRFLRWRALVRSDAAVYLHV
jgi:hypothetical protein